MQVILLRDVARIGRKYDIKNVPDGHALNFLIPRGLAEKATPQTLARIAARGAQAEIEQEAVRERLDKLQAELKAAPLIIEVAANEQGHLFKGLRAEEVARALSERAGVPIAPASVLLSRPIKDIGVHEVTLAEGGKEALVSVEVRAAS